MPPLRTTVETLATPAGRMIGTPGHRAARDYLVSRLGTHSVVQPDGDSFVLPYGPAESDLANVIARIPGDHPERAPVLLAAHYDTCGPLPGADDNAAAIAVLLDLIPQLGGLERPVILAFFDGEEPPLFLGPHMGSIHWYHQQRQGPVHCAIVLDLVGHDVPLPTAEDLVFVTGMESDPSFGQLVLEADPVSGVRMVPTLNQYLGDLSDHHAFREDRCPYLFFSCGRWEHYHQATDTPERLNYAKMAAFRDWLLQLLPPLCSAPLQGPFEGYDTTEIECTLMNRHLGTLLDSLGGRVESRDDITRVVNTLVGGFGL